MTTPAATGIPTGVALPGPIVAFYAVTAGFSRDSFSNPTGGAQAGYSDAAVAVAIAYAESGWKPNATHSNSNGTEDVGLWQINDVHSDDPEFSKRTDPAANARIAFRIFTAAGKTFKDWTTYNSGDYAQYVLMGVQAVQALPSTVVPGGIKGGGKDSEYIPWLAGVYKSWLKGMGVPEAEADTVSKEAARGNFGDVLKRGAEAIPNAIGDAFGQVLKYVAVGAGALLILLGIVMIAKNGA